MLTFTLYYLCKNPEAMRKAREEVDEVLGDEPIRLEHIGKLKYISGTFLTFVICGLKHSIQHQLACESRFVSHRPPPSVWSSPWRTRLSVGANTPSPRVPGLVSWRQSARQIRRSGVKTYVVVIRR